MADFKVKCPELKGYEDGLDSFASSLRSIQSDVDSVRRSLAFQIASSRSIENNLRKISESINNEYYSMQRMSDGLGRCRRAYDNAEDRICRNANVKNGWMGAFAEEFKSNFGLGEMISGAGHISSIYELVDGFKSATSWSDMLKTGYKTMDFIKDAAKTYNKYKKIGRAVGTKKAMTWWAKNITGLKKVGRVSTAKDLMTRFKNNLTNKTSPFRAQFTEVIDDFKGKNGVKKGLASWAGVVLDLGTNFISNRHEQAASGGEMSDARVVAETITETAIDTVVTYGAGIVIGAAVAAVAPAAATGIVIGAVSSLVVAGVNAGVKAFTGKTATEWASDKILDTGEKIIKGIGNCAKKTTKTVSKWFKSWAFA